MFAERKRRYLSLTWSLPVVVAIMFLLVAKLAALQRADVIAALADQVAHGDTSDATFAVRNLATMPRPPLAQLVEAAASPNLDVAREAQLAIDDYLQYCQRDIKAGRHVKVVAAQLAALAESLAHQQRSFSVVDYPWVESTTRKVLRLANRIPSRTTPLVAARCDEILAAISADVSPTTPPSAATASNSQSLLTDDVAPTERGGEQDLTDMRQDQRLAALAARPWTDSPSGAGVGTVVTPPSPPPTTTTVDAATRQFSVSFQPPTVNAPPTGLVFGEDGTASVLPAGPSDSGWQAQWSHPMFRSLPAMPIDAVPIAGGGMDAMTDGPRTEWLDVPRQFDAADERFEGVDSRKLLARWLVAEGTEVYPLEQELTDRGFGRLSARLAQQLFSDQAEDRLRLVDDVLTEPGVDARPWLLLLADDADVDVRLVVVTIMATSNDPALIEKAWQVAIRDRDPRIAGLAERLRERRGVGRRR